MSNKINIWLLTLVLFPGCTIHSQMQTSYTWEISDTLRTNIIISKTTKEDESKVEIVLSNLSKKSIYLKLQSSEIPLTILFMDKNINVHFGECYNTLSDGALLPLVKISPKEEIRRFFNIKKNILSESDLKLNISICIFNLEKLIIQQHDEYLIGVYDYWQNLKVYNFSLNLNVH